MRKILVGYITKTDTTKEIAEKIGAILKGPGIEVDIRNLEQVTDLSQYSDFILGAPINGMRLIPAFAAFVEANGSQIKKTIGVFAVSYLYPGCRKFWKRMIHGSATKAAKDLECNNVTVFGGRMKDPMPGFANFLFGLPKGYPLDNRDWAAVEEWASALRQQ